VRDIRSLESNPPILIEIEFGFQESDGRPPGRDRSIPPYLHIHVFVGETPVEPPHLESNSLLLKRGIDEAIQLRECRSDVGLRIPQTVEFLITIHLHDAGDLGGVLPDGLLIHLNESSIGFTEVVGEITLCVHVPN
jgi:hypothetical protein